MMPMINTKSVTRLGFIASTSIDICTWSVRMPFKHPELKKLKTMRFNAASFIKIKNLNQHYMLMLMLPETKSILLLSLLFY